MNQPSINRAPRQSTLKNLVQQVELKSSNSQYSLVTPSQEANLDLRVYLEEDIENNLPVAKIIYTKPLQFGETVQRSYAISKTKDHLTIACNEVLIAATDDICADPRGVLLDLKREVTHQEATDLHRVLSQSFVHKAA